MHLMVTGFTLLPKLLCTKNVFRACAVERDKGGKFALLTLILVYCSVRDCAHFLRHRIRKYPDSSVHTLSDSLRIYFFPLWRADLFFFRNRCRISRDACGRKPYPERKTCGFENIPIRVDGALVLSGRSVWENLDRGRRYRPNPVRSVPAIEVKILPYRPT